MKNFFTKFRWDILKKFYTEENTINLGANGKGEYTADVFEFAEVVGATAIPEFKEKAPTEWRTFFQQFQGSSSACVSYTLAKIVAVLYFIKTGRKVKFSPGFWYPRRINRPGEGMAFDDLQKLGTDGAIPEDFLPCEGLSEDQMNAIKIEQYHRDAADAFALPPTWVNLPLEFDTVAATIERTGKGIMIWVDIREGEYFRNRTPILLPNSRRVSGHSICGVDAFKFLGLTYILCEDSAESGDYLRLITRDFFKARAYLARYPINFKFEIPNNKPAFDGSIISAQKCLQFEGIFPSNIPYAENVGPVTQKSIKTFQQKYGLSVTGSLDSPTLGKLTQLYG